MNRTIAVLVGSFVISSMTVSLSAAATQDSKRIIHGRAHRIHTPVKRRIWIATPTTAHPSRIVTRSSYTHTPAAEPSHFEVQLVNTTITLDPTANYMRQGEYPIDENHSLPTAQRLYRSLTAKPARVIRKRGHAPRTAVNTMPQIIIMKQPVVPTEGLRRNWKQKQIPSVPRPPKKHRRMMAMATEDPTS